MCIAERMSILFTQVSLSLGSVLLGISGMSGSEPTKSRREAKEEWGAGLACGWGRTDMLRHTNLCRDHSSSNLGTAGNGPFLLNSGGQFLFRWANGPSHRARNIPETLYIF